MPKALLFPMRYGQLLRSYSAWARINSSSISCDSSCRQQFRLIASLWAGSPRVDEVSRSITGYIYIFIYLFIHIYNTNAWNCLEFPGSRSTMYRQDPTISSGFRGQDDAWYVVRLGLSFLTSPLPGRRCPKDSFPSNPTTENTNNCRKNTNYYPIVIHRSYK